MKKIIFSFICLLLFCGCERSKELKALPSINTLNVKDRFTVILPEDHRNGYTWVLDREYDASICDHLNTVWHGNDKGVYFEFKCLKAGDCTLKFLSRKYTDTLDIKVFSLKVKGS